MLFPRIAYKFITAIVVILGVFVLYLSERSLRNQFDKRSIELAKNTVVSVQKIESEMDKTLVASAFLVEEKLLNNGIKTDKDLLDLRRKLGVTTISILEGQTGKFVMTSNEVFDKNNPFYKDLSVIDTDQCATQRCGGELCRTEHEVLNCKIKRFDVLRAIDNPEVPYLLPMMRVTLRSNESVKAPAKWVVLYSKKADKIIDIFYAKEDINHILEDYVEIHSGLVNYIEIMDNRGNLIAYAGNKSIKKSKMVSVSFQEARNFNIDNDYVDYQYILNIQLSKAEFYKQLTISRILLITIIILILLLIRLFRFITLNQECNLNVFKSILIKQKTNN